LANTSKLSIVRTDMTQYFGQDLPTLPPHWHSSCDCEPTVAYIRVSKVGKRVVLKSPTIQFDEIIRDARANKRNIVDLVFDINVSGRDFDRKAFGEVIAAINEGRYRHVSVWKWSRWGRNTRASLVMLNELDQMGARVDSATEPIDASTSYGKFSLNQALAMAEFQSQQIGEGWQKAHGLRLESQLPHSGRKRFGYDYNNTDPRNPFFELNQAEAEILEWAYLEFIKGLGTRKIAEELNSAGFRTEFGNLFTFQGAGKMLDTGFAAGLLRNRSEEMKARMKRKPANTLASYDLWLPGKQDNIIDIGTWETFKGMRLENAKKPARLRKAVHEVSALVFCGLCARRMQTHYGGPQRQHRWQCEARNSFHTDKGVSISNDDVLMLVKEWLRGKAQKEWVEQEARKDFERRLAAMNNTTTTAAEMRLAEIERELTQVMALFKSAAGRPQAVIDRVLDDMTRLEEEKAELGKRIAPSTPVKSSKPDFTAMGRVVAEWGNYSAEEHNSALSKSIGLILVSPPSRPRIKSELRERVRIVGRWEMGEMESWLASLRQRPA
jgi:site-specific DNA recombinase